MPTLTAKTAKSLHNLAFEASELSGSVKENETEVYSVAIAEIAKFEKGGFLGLQVSEKSGSLDREELAAAQFFGMSLSAGPITLTAPSRDVLTLARVALLATDKDEFGVEDIENLLLPAEASERAAIAAKVRGFADDLEKTQQRVFAILEEIDEIVADGLGLIPAEHDTIRERCKEFPLSVTVERPRFAWSADRKSQARRTYRPGERFKA
jgi:hypothetical protein